MDIVKHNFEIIRRKIIVTPKIKGLNDFRDFDFILDTGASKSLIDEKVAMRLGFDLEKLKTGDRLMTVGGGVNSKILSLPKINLFGQDFDNFEVDVVDMPPQILVLAVGIIGMDFLLKFKRISFDFETKTIATPFS